MQLELEVIDHCCAGFTPIERETFGIEPNLACDRVKTCCKNQANWPLIQLQARGYHLPCAPVVPPVPELPKVVLSTKGDLSHLAFMPVLGSEAWAVPYLRALAGDLVNSNRLNAWLRHQRLATERLVLLHQESMDVELNRLFPKTYHPNFFNIVGSAPNCVAIAPGYSVYDDGTMCREHQLLNMKRSADFFVRACENGVACVPYLGWNLRQDLDRLAGWITKHPSLRYAAINCQTIGHTAFPKLAEEMHYIEAAARPIHWVIFGGKSVVNYLSGHGFSDRLTLVTAALFHAAKLGQSYDDEYAAADKFDLFLHNYEIVKRSFTVWEPAGRLSTSRRQRHFYHSPSQPIYSNCVAVRRAVY